jgi:hypothetical protein
MPVARSIPNGVMRVAIHFDDQAAAGTEEIDDAAADYVLAAEFVAAELGAAEMRPQLRFERRRSFPVCFGAFEEAYVLHLDSPPPLAQLR